jgi:CheY-like chemotaxis protein
MDKPCILVVDDSNTNIVLLEAILEEKGYHIQTAVNALEAADCIKKRIPDLILLDLLMPKISGFDFLEKLRLDEKTWNIPVIVVSAVIDGDSRKRIHDLGASGYIQKPVNIQQLIESVARVLQPFAE